MAIHSEWLRNNPQWPQRAPLPWALGPEALRAGEPEKNKERHFGVTSPLRCDLAPLKGRGGCAATRSRMIDVLSISGTPDHVKKTLNAILFEKNKKSQVPKKLSICH